MCCSRKYPYLAPTEGKGNSEGGVPKGGSFREGGGGLSSLFLGGGFRVWLISKLLLILLLSVIQSKNYCFRNTIVVGSCKNFRLSICCFVTQYIVVFNVISEHVLIRLLLTFFQLKGNNWSSLFWEMVSLVWCTAVSPPWFSMTIGQLHDDDIWLQLPEFNSVLLCYLNFSIPLRINEQ